MTASALFFLAATFVGFGLICYLLGWWRGSQAGFRDGERYGIGRGYRQAWLTANRPLLSPTTEDWNDEED